MKEGFRQSMAWLHTWLGLIVGWLLYFVYLTGTLGYVDREIDYWMTPDRPFFAAPGTPHQQLALAQTRLQSVAPSGAAWNIQLLGGREAPALNVSWTDAPLAGASRGVVHRETLDPRSGLPLDYGPRATGGGQVLYKMHYQLAYLSYDKAILFIMACTVIMFSAMVTGIIAHKNIFKDLFTFRPQKGQRSWLDAHNLLGVTALPFHLIVTYSGLLFFTYQFMPTVPNLVYGAGERSNFGLYQTVYPTPAGPPLPQAAHEAAPLVSLAPLLDQADRLWGPNVATSVEVRNPGDANARVLIRQRNKLTPELAEASLVFEGPNGRLVEDYRGHEVYAAGKADEVMKGLHKGLFAGGLLRVLYVFMGACGTAMIAAGLLLWSNKRTTRLAGAGQPVHFGIRLVDRLNAATLIGVPVAIAAYFWANRLLPVTLERRAEWEVHTMYLTLAAMFLYALTRPPERTRVEMLWLCAGAYALLPVLNALTTQRHLGHSLAQGDWIMAGFDLTALALGAIAAACALKVRQSSFVSSRLPGRARSHTRIS